MGRIQSIKHIDQRVLKSYNPATKRGDARRHRDDIVSDGIDPVVGADALIIGNLRPTKQPHISGITNTLRLSVALLDHHFANSSLITRENTETWPKLVALQNRIDVILDVAQGLRTRFGTKMKELDLPSDDLIPRQELAE